MKTMALYECDPAKVMQYADVPNPVMGLGDVMVQVQACRVNGSDLVSRAGTSRWSFELPMVLGAEFTGSVVHVGDRVGRVQPGDLVTALQQYSCAAVRSAPSGCLICASPSRSLGPHAGWVR